MYKKRHDIELFLKDSGPVTLVEVETVHGSAPRDSGTWMLVGSNSIFRTIGGGQLENIAIEKARALLSSHDHAPIEMLVPLGPHIGQCCGGTVNLRINILDQLGLQTCVGLVETEMLQLPSVYIFGAGHIGNALASALSLLPINPVLIDTREAELAMAPGEVETRLTAMPETEVRDAAPNSAFVILTHDHSLDFLIASEALMRNDATYVGMIGSKTKRATFRNWLRRENGNEARINNLVCPIGNSVVRDKRPEVIAALVAAEIVAHLQRSAAMGNQVSPCQSLQMISGESG